MWVRLAGGIAAGGIAYAAFPPRNLWFLTPVALGILYTCLTVGRPRARTGALVGAVFGLAFFLPLLPWIGQFVGAFPWIALCVTMAIYTAAFGLMATVTTRLPAAPLWFALTWVAIETLRSAFPFGGFPWGVSAFSQNTGLFLPLARWLGVPGLSFAVALVGAGGAALIVAAINRSGVRTAAIGAALAVVTILAAVVAGATAPNPNAGPHLPVAAVQGNVPQMGWEFNERRRAVLDNHVRETLTLANQVEAGAREKPAMVLWPENASDISPLQNEDAKEIIQAAVGAVGVPILLGSFAYNEQGDVTNSVLMWTTDDGKPADLPTGRYDKHIVQPFGEYLPWRPFFSLFSSHADQAGDIHPGTGSSVITVPTTSGNITVGIATCWEVAFDRATRQSVRDGAQFLFIPTNNATFGETAEMTYQQLAMSQVRAVETDRATAVVATSGVSALINPDGTIIERSGIFQPAILQSQLPLRETQTLAVRFGSLPKTVILICALLGFLFALGRHTRFRTLTVRPSARTATPTGAPTDTEKDTQ